jgi:hypothetical protein
MDERHSTSAIFFSLEMEECTIRPVEKTVNAMCQRRRSRCENGWAAGEEVAYEFLVMSHLNIQNSCHQKTKRIKKIPAGDPPRLRLKDERRQQMRLFAPPRRNKNQA